MDVTISYTKATVVTFPQPFPTVAFLGSQRDIQGHKNQGCA